MAFPRRRFSVFQRDQRVTVGPLGFDVPITTDTSAFPSADTVDEEDRLSDVEYPDPGHDRHAKRQRIEDYARDYLCGKPLDIYTASLRGPVTKSYWGKKATVTGTLLELKAAEMKDSILTAKRDARRLRGRQTTSPHEQQQAKITSTMKATKAVQTPVGKPEEVLLVLDSQQALELSQSQSQRLVSSPPKKFEVIDTPLANKQASAQMTSADIESRDAVAPDGRSLDAAETANPDKSLSGDAVLGISGKANRGTRNPKLPAGDPTFGQSGAVHKPADDIIVPATSQLDPLPNRAIPRTSPSKPKQKPVIKQTIQSAQDDAAKEPKSVSEPKTGPEADLVQTESMETLNFDLDKIDRIARRLSADDSVNFFQNEAEPRTSRDQSPATALKESLRRIDKKQSSRSHAPPSPTAEAILRKAQKVPAIKRRNNLGGRSLNDIIAQTSRTLQPARHSRRSQASENLDIHDKTSKAEVPAAPTPDPQAAAQVVEALEPPVPATVQNPAPTHEQAIEQPTANADEDTTVVTMLSTSPVLETPVTETRPTIRLSQLPTPKPPSPLQLRSAPKQGTPNIPETVEEEVVEKPIPLDMSLKENEPALKPGPRRAKRTAPRTRTARPAGSQPSSNEELKAALSARRIATPISRLQETMAQFSPVSPMNQRPVSPIAESQGQGQNQSTSLRRQEQLREEQQKGSSQLSSPPLSSPPGDRAPSSAKNVPPEEPVVQVPTSSKDVATNQTGLAPNSRPVSAGVPPSPPQDAHEEESTIEMSSGHYRRIEESLQNAAPVAIPLAAGDGATSHVSASHPENSISISPIMPDDTLSNAAQPKVDLLPPPTLPPPSTRQVQEDVPKYLEQVDDGNDSTDSEDLDLPPRKQPSKPAVLVPGTPAEDPTTQASVVAVPESFKRAIAAPIAYTYETPGAPLPPPYIPVTSGFTPINSERVAATDPVEPSSPTPNSGARAGPFTSPLRCIEFTPFRSFTSPGRAKTPDRPNIDSELSALEPTTIFEVSKIVEKTGDGGREMQSSYDFDQVLGGVSDWLMSDVYDVEEEARRLSTNVEEPQSQRRRRL
ncbi:hypothetical protein ABW21_db0207137 [Orbilia brochopaga]|nr:hypothetical protein ABW21_db0207137 [Drechslerella brochopaga]